MRTDFAVFILTHGRPERVVTIDELRRCGYTGRIYLVCDDGDSTLPEYYNRYGKDNVFVFSKADVKFDIMDNFPGDKVIVYARNVIFDLAKKLGLTYFWELEDDYKSFEYRWKKFSDEKQELVLGVKKISNLDAVIDIYLKFLDISGAHCLAMLQGGDYIGGVGCDLVKKSLKRKAMNTLFCRTDRPFTFVGRMNDDVNTYLSLGMRGYLFFQGGHCSITQAPTQQTKSGNTDAYKSFGTYVKSFYSVMICPSACKVKLMRSTHPRIHHKINWNNAVPKIISDVYRKGGK